MPYAAFPAGPELGAFLVENGYASVAPSLAGAYAGAAADAFQRETGWVPFLRDGSDVARLFDCPEMGFPFNWRVPFAAGLLAVTSVESAWDGTTGTAKTATLDYLLGGGDGTDTRPYQWLDLRHFPGRQPQSIRIVGRWGYSATVPDDVYLAVLSKAAADYVRARDGGAGNVRSVKQGPVQFDYGAAGEGPTAALDLQYMAAVARHRRFPIT